MNLFANLFGNARIAERRGASADGEGSGGNAAATFARWLGHDRAAYRMVGAIGLASVIFMLIHLPAYGLGDTALASIALSLTALFVGSMIFGSIYEWTGNLTVVALVHGVYNSILLVLLYFVSRYEEEIQELSQQGVVLVGF